MLQWEARGWALYLPPLHSPNPNEDFALATPEGSLKMEAGLKDGQRGRGQDKGVAMGGAWSGMGVASEAPSGSRRLTLKRTPTLAWNGHILSVPFRVCSVLCSISVLIKITSIDLVLVNH